MVLDNNIKSTRKITSGSTTIHDAKCLLRKIIINEAGKKCIIVIKDDTTIKHLLMPEYSAIVGKPNVLKVNSPISTSLKVEMTKLDPVLLLKFNNNSTTLAEDLSGSNIDGTMTNMEAADRYEDAERGKALNFSGTDEYITLGDNFDWDLSSEARSFSFWIYKASAQTGMVLAKRGADQGWDIHCGSDNTIRLYARTATATVLNVSSVGTIPTNAWTHITITHDGTGKALGTTFYINGVATTKTTSQDDLAATSANSDALISGALNGGVGAYFIGKLDEIMIFNRAITAAEAEYLYRNDYGYAAVDGCKLADITLVYET